MQIYSEDYYERGVEKNISGYQNYRWLPEQTISMCSAIVNHCNIKKEDRILDFGCAKGFVVKAFFELGYDCWGCDVSQYAIENCDESVKHRLVLVNSQETNEWLLQEQFDFILCKDVLEHIPEHDIRSLLNAMSKICNKVFVIVPLAEDGKYVVPEYEGDITHIVRRDMKWWEEMMLSADFEVHSSYLVPGIKDNWSHYSKGNGFFLCTKR